VSSPGPWFSPGSQFAKPYRTSREAEFRVVREDIARLAALLGIEIDGTTTAHVAMVRIIAAVQAGQPRPEAAEQEEQT
jgi:hypothetical protein